MYKSLSQRGPGQDISMRQAANYIKTMNFPAFSNRPCAFSGQVVLYPILIISHTYKIKFLAHARMKVQILATKHNAPDEQSCTHLIC